MAVRTTGSVPILIADAAADLTGGVGSSGSLAYAIDTGLLYLKGAAWGASGGVFTVLDKQQQAAGTTLSYAVAGGTLAVDEDEIWFTYSGTSSNANPVSQITYGGVTVWDGSAVGNANALFCGFGWIRRTGSSSQAYGIMHIANGTNPAAVVNGVLALDNSASQTLSLLTAVAGAGGVSRALAVYKVAA